MDMSEVVMFWATVMSPMIGVVAIIVALVIAHQSSKEAKEQISSVYKLLDVFVASRLPEMQNAKLYYETQLEILTWQIKETIERKMLNRTPFLGRGARIEDIEEMEESGKIKNELDNLLGKKKNLEMQLKFINYFLSKTGK